MFQSYLTDFNLIVGGLLVAFILGVVFSTKVKDLIKGIPAQARAALNQVEADTVAKIKSAQAQVISTLPGVTVAKAPLAPLAPAAAAVALTPAPALAPAPAPAPVA